VMTSPVATCPSPPRRAVVGLDVVRSNARILFAESPGLRTIVDLRANAYGHGAGAIAEVLDDLPVDAFLLSSEQAAEPLVNLGLKTPVILRSRSTADGTRLIGPELFGLDSPAEPDPRARGLLPALTLSARVLSVKKVGAGEGVSYGYVYRTSAATTLAMVCLGYSDGIDRHACERGRAWFDGCTHPIAGRVAMDVFMLDVGDHPVSPGDEVVLFGDEGRGYPSPISWAADLGRSAAEVTAALGDRIVRSHV
jgi:alanine racemase